MVGPPATTLTDPSDWVTAVSLTVVFCGRSSTLPASARFAIMEYMSGQAKIDYLATLLSAVRGTVGSVLFASLYVRQDGKLSDILEGGRVSCAYFVSVLLHALKLIETPHATVSGTVADLEGHGWIRLDRPRPGAVLLWEPADHDGSANRHLGFYVGDDRAISNSTSQRVIAEHHWTFGEHDGRPVRGVKAVYWHPTLG